MENVAKLTYFEVLSMFFPMNHLAYQSTECGQLCCSGRVESYRYRIDMSKKHWNTIWVSSQYGYWVDPVNITTA